MKKMQNDVSVPVFEIDQPAVYGQYIISNRLEILLHLNKLQAMRSLVTLYFDDAASFFLSTIVAVDEENDTIYLDAASQPETNQSAAMASQLTLTAALENIKIQIRLNQLTPSSFEGKQAFSATLPASVLRLQRREFFRVTTPLLKPLRCKLAAPLNDGHLHVFDLPLYDLSGGGLSLLGKVDDAEKFTLGEIFHDCRLEIPGENVLSVNLRVCEVIKIETVNGEQQLRLGCEFISLPGTRLSLIERYITRLERERKARENGLE